MVANAVVKLHPGECTRFSLSCQICIVERAMADCVPNEESDM